MKPVRLLGVALVVGGIVVACDPAPVGVDLPALSPQAAARLKLGPGVNGLVQCTPLLPDSVTQVIGPEGGELNVGPHTLDVPPLALADTVSITAVAPSDTVRWIRFKPDGLVFLQAASLSMSYKNCKTKLGQSPRIAQVSDSLNVQGYLLSTTDQWAKWVIGDLYHFSNYAVAW